MTQLPEHGQGGSHFAGIDDFLLTILPLNQQRIMTDLLALVIDLESSGDGDRIEGGDRISDFRVLEGSGLQDRLFEYLAGTERSTGVI